VRDRVPGRRIVIALISARSTVLARDFDGALYVRDVTPGTGMVADRAYTLLQVFGLAVDHPLPAATGLVVVLGWLVVAVTRRVRRT